MTSDPTDGLTLTYDPENRIQGAGGYTYTYDADGNRVKKTNGSTGTIYWYMTPGIVAESDLSGTLKSEYVFFDGERVARRDLPAGAVAYYFSDHLKTASVITDSLGNIKSESDYYPWGGELQFIANDSNHYKFTGKERDETGLDYFGARYYSNGLARFITPDNGGSLQPNANPKTLNLYTYGFDNPLRFSDEEGFDAVDRVKRAAAQIGTPYLTNYGGGKNNGGVDCSGLCQISVGADLGASFPRTAEGQFHFAQDNKDFTTDPSQVQPGDEVFLASNSTGKIVHVGIVDSVKDGKITIIEAPGHNKDGSPKLVKRISLYAGTKAGSPFGDTQHIAGYGLWHNFDQGHFGGGPAKPGMLQSLINAISPLFGYNPSKNDVTCTTQMSNSKPHKC